jgi:hypothetical protein
MAGLRFVDSAFPLPRLLARGCGIAGAGAVFASLFVPWFTVPGLAGEPIWSSVFRVLTGSFLASALVLAFRRRSSSTRIAHLASGLLVALLFFPYFVTVWSPQFAGEASWLHGQHESLTGSAGDLYRAQETKADGWRQRVDVVNRPIVSEIVDLPDWTRLDAGRLIDVSAWFGASPWFAIFVRKGWVLALCGTAACLLVLLRECAAVPRAPLVVAQRGGVLLAAAVALALVPPGAAVVLLQAARNSASASDSRSASRQLDHAVRYLPALRADGSLVIQRGLLDDALHIASPEAAIFRARLAEWRGFDGQARALALAVLRRPTPPAVHREGLKMLLSLGADALNSGDFGGASTLYAAVLEHDPQNLKASYALQLLAVRQGDLPRVRLLQAQMETVYRTFNSPTKKAVLALAHENAAFAEALDGNPAATWAALARARQP